jgi:hypothetical protein
MPNYKYAALLLPRVDSTEGVVQLAHGKTTLVGSLSELVRGQELSHWKEWLGSMAWDSIDERRRIVVLRRETQTPEVLDAENESLQASVSNAWRAFLLCKAHPFQESESWILSGDAVGGVGADELVTVRSVARLDAVVRPMYTTSDAFWKTYIDDAVKSGDVPGRGESGWFEVWRELDAALCRGTWPELLGHALLAHGMAMTLQQLEFVIPGLVRAAEGVIALGKGMGAAVFKDRALQLVPTLGTDPYIGRCAEPLLLELYQARSDCVHGKIPFFELRRQGKAGEERAAQLSYVADVLARGALQAALRHKDATVFSSRDTLEAAWRGKLFP